MKTAIKRRKTRIVKLGNVKIGYAHPISVQSMLKVPTHDVKACLSEIKRLKDAGCDIVRLAVKTKDDADAIKNIARQSALPLEADIHFNWQFALKAMEGGIDAIRLNPGNISKKEHIEPIVSLAKKKRVPIRVGINSGSLPITSYELRVTSYEKMAISALRYIKILEQMHFYDIMISLKSSDVKETVEAYRYLAARCNYPLHLGVTATGHGEIARFKSAIGIGSLLLDGIGDTIRVSLTDDSVAEVLTARQILKAVGLSRDPIEILSCPTCGRCQVDLIGMVKKLESRFLVLGSRFSRKPLKVAVMGCEVNGPGEAKAADIGIAFGKGSGILFKKGRIIKRLSAKNCIKELIKQIRESM